MQRKTKRNRCTFTSRKNYLKCKSKYGNWSCSGKKCTRKLIQKMKKQCCR